MQPPDCVWLWVCCGWQAQPLHDLYRDEVLLAPAIDNELQRGTLYPHLGMEEALPLALLLTVGFPPVLDMGGDFEE